MSAAAAQELQLPELMRLLAVHKSAKATFVERKFIGILDKPVDSSGELSFTAPDRLEKRTVSPRVESLVLEGDRLTIESNGKKMVISLQAHPEAAAFVESIRGTLAGDLGALEKFYSVQLSGGIEHWKLQLVPRQPEMLRIVSRIRFEGSQSAVNSIVFEQADGDRSEMQVTPVPAQ
jgi:hypothetical protein